jgi:membrane-bound metal-dependent hydrolase YbcI (DUF457 family)
MPFPVAHGLLGASVVFAGDPKPASWNRRSLMKLVAGVVLGNLPDLDFIGVWFFHFDKSWHRGASHSIFIAIVVGIICSIAAKEDRRRWLIVCAVAVASHGILDFAVSTRSGCELLWPVSFHRFALGLVEYPDSLDIRYVADIDTLIVRDTIKFLKVSLLEALFASPVFVVCALRSRLAARLRSAPFSTST